MSQGSRPSYLDCAEDNDDVLNKSWDVESRHRLQENALKLQRESSEGAEEVFRARVELGLHELTAALSSLSRRIDKLEENTAPPEKEKQDQAVKELARGARCLSQALPGIASSRTRRRALHGYFREADEQRGDCGNRIDPATRALVVEGLSCLAGKVRVDTAWGNKIEGRGSGSGMGSGLGRSGGSRGLSPSSPRRRRSPTRSTRSTKRGERAGTEAEKQEKEEKESGFDGAAAVGINPLNGGDGGKAREFALPVPRGLGFGSPVRAGDKVASDRLEIEHLGSLGAPSPITLTGSVDGRMFPPAPAPKKTETGRSSARTEEPGDVAEPTSGQGMKRPQQRASERESDSPTPLRESSSGTSRATNADPPARVAPPTRGSPYPTASSGDAPAAFNGGGRTASNTRRARSTNDGGIVETPPTSAEVEPSRSASEKPGRESSNTTSEGASTGGDIGDGAGVGVDTSASERELVARVLLNAAGAAAEAEERAGGPWAWQEEKAEKHSVARGEVVGGGGGGNGGASGGRIGDGDMTSSCQAEVEAVRALSSRGRARRLASRASQASCCCSSSSSSSSSSCGSASVTAAVAAATALPAMSAEIPDVSDAVGDKAASVTAAAAAAEEASSGGLRVAAAPAPAPAGTGASSGSTSTQPLRWRSLLHADDEDGGGRELTTAIINGGEHRPSLNSNGSANGGGFPSLDNGNASPFVDEQGFLDLGAASTSGRGMAGLEVEGKWPKRPDPTGSDPRVKELESKLEELKRIGDRIKEEAASTAEPRVTIPTQDLTGLDLLLRTSRFGEDDNDNDNGNDTSGSMFNFPSSSSRHRHRQQQQLQQVVVRSGRALGNAPPSAAAAAAATAAAAFSAFTSPEPSPAMAVRAAEDGLSSGAAAPAIPQDHPATEPALSRLLVPPSFDNEALRGDFIASLERHLAEYEDGAGGGGEEVGGVGADSGHSLTGGYRGGSVLKDGGRAKRGGERDAVEACGGGGGSTAAPACSGRANDDGIYSLARSKTTAVGGTPASSGLGKDGPSRAVVVSQRVSEADSAAVMSEGPAVAASRTEVPGRKGEPATKKRSVVSELSQRREEDVPETGTTESNNWAQEYHDYLCSKES